LSEKAPVFGRGSLSRFADSFSFPSGRAFLVSSKNVLGRCGTGIRLALPRRRGAEIVISDREADKTFRTLESILDRLIEAGIRRDDFIVSFGGGVVSDLAGFAAAVVLRGIGWYAVPTTLLAMADAAIGGKTAVDHPRGKNLVGAFHPPSGVLIDPDLLETLPDRQFRSGLAEIYKAGLIGDAGLARRMSGRLEEIAQSRRIDRFLGDAIAVKRRIVSRDPRENGQRRFLNFGHTLGHAIEASGGYRRFTHGESVALGMAAALHLSARKAGFPAGEAQSRIEELAGFAGRERSARIDPRSPALWQSVSRDKKSTSRGTMAVLLAAPGRPLLRPVSEADWRKALLHVLRSFAL
jgi:3-dehydroquinate synthase